jgi:hypothetical protein
MLAAAAAVFKRQIVPQELLVQAALVAAAMEPITIQLPHLEQLILAEAAVEAVIHLRLVAQAETLAPASSS